VTLPPAVPLRITALTALVYRAPIARPVRTAFGSMTDRPAVIVEARASDGTVGYGEVWCNFPTCGAEHRARLVTSFLAPLVVDRTWSGPGEVFRELSARAAHLALQTGEPGPLAQAIAGIDIALWDLAARRAGQPLWRLLGGTGDGRLPAYASGINPDQAVAQARAARAGGHRAFKLKIGFGRRTDLDNLEALRAALGPEAPIAVDANQAWDPAAALEMAAALAPFEPLWLEEPIAADSAEADWRRLAAATPIPLAAGENLRGDAAFDRAIAAGALAVIQPDVAKWGGITGCLPLAQRITAGGRRYCPHYLGGGIGLLASAHLLAAAGGDGMLEIDCNPNPLREGLATPFPILEDGHLALSEAPGLGVIPGPAVARYRRAEV
jgi:D-galactarolactone cycloisomerase